MSISFSDLKVQSGSLSYCHTFPSGKDNAEEYG